MRSLTLPKQRKATVLDDRSGTSLLTQRIGAAYSAVQRDLFRAACAFRGTYTAVNVSSFQSTPRLDGGDREGRSSLQTCREAEVHFFRLL